MEMSRWAFLAESCTANDEGSSGLQHSAAITGSIQYELDATLLEAGWHMEAAITIMSQAQELTRDPQ